jgi:hypothetical protein
MGKAGVSGANERHFWHGSFFLPLFLKCCRNLRAMEFLLPSQKLQLHKILNHYRFNPADFDLVCTSKDARLKFKGTEFFFNVTTHKAEYSLPNYQTEVSLGREKMIETHYLNDWRSVEVDLGYYLQSLRREVTIVDPWAEAEKFAKEVRELSIADKANEPITEIETLAIWKALGGIQATLLEHVRGDVEKGEYIVQSIEQLKQGMQLLQDSIKDSNAKFGRKEYLGMLFNALIGIAITVSFPQNSWPLLFGAFREAIRHLLK